MERMKDEGEGERQREGEGGEEVSGFSQQRLLLLDAESPVYATRHYWHDLTRHDF